MCCHVVSLINTFYDNITSNQECNVFVTYTRPVVMFGICAAFVRLGILQCETRESSSMQLENCTCKFVSVCCS